jgi:hypothetical protein
MSNTNYILSSGSSPVAQLTVTINVTQDIVCRLSGGGVDPGDEVLGFAFQLNAYTQAGNKNFQNCAWQQYFFVLNPGNVLVAVVNNYTLKQGPNVLDGFNLVTANGVSLPPFANCAIPAGSQLAITLDFDTAFNVTGASYSFQFEPSGTAYTASCALTSLDLYNTSTQLTSDYIAPIVAFEVNIVGPRNGEYTYLSSGAGTITYFASRGPLLTVLNSEPSNLDYTGAEETSNCAYGPLPAIASSFFIQSFAVRAFPLG